MVFSSRRLLAGLCIGLSLGSIMTLPAYAQSRGQGEQETAEDRAQKEDEWGDRNLNLRRLKADGPCPFVKVLYDAARYHEFKDSREATSAAMWTGEINGVTSDCAYRGEEPIQVGMSIGFSLGRGPQADGQAKTYRYWVAVTERDSTVLAKQYFDLPVTFAEGQQRIDVNTQIEGIVIPRADVSVSGANFEVLVGFDVTPQMIAFNREGKHFRYVTSAEQN